MSYRNLTILSVFIVILLTGSINGIAQATGSLAIGLNRIEGRVIDESNTGINDVWVELYDNYGALINRTKSTGSGRFSFRGMAPGRYTIYAKPYGTNLVEESKEVEINNQYSRSDTQVVDFHLRVDKRFRNEEIAIAGTIFVQEIPDDAKRLYTSGMAAIGSNQEKGLADLQEAIKLFPNYFNALTALGKTYVLGGKYDIGYPYLLRAIDVNQRCADCYYGLALAFYKLDQLTAATKAIDATVVLETKVPAVYLLQGIIYRLNGNFTGAEKALLTAKSMFKAPNADLHMQLSMVYNHLNRNQEAADELEKYLSAKTDISGKEKEEIRELIAKLRKSGNSSQTKNPSF